MCIYFYRRYRRKQREKLENQSLEPQNPGKKPKSSKPPCIHQQEALQQQADAGDNVATPARQKCQVCKDEKRAARIYRWKIIGGLLFPFALQALDVTIIASALPFIAQDFGQLNQLNWIVSSFNLCSAAFIPFWGQMADIFGRHWTLQTAVFIMLVGSALCTAAPTDTYAVLLLGRAFQGIAGAGINVIIRVVLSDKVSLKENAKNWTIFALVAGFSYGLGPVIGGYLTKVSWRWCFAINMPICLLAIVTVFFLLRKELLGPQPIVGVDDLVPAPDDGHASLPATATTTSPPTPPPHSTNAPAAAAAVALPSPRTPGARRALFLRRLATVDAGGQLLFLFGFGLLILGLTWAGGTYGWGSAAVLAPLVIGAALCVGFVAWEFLMAPGRPLRARLPLQKPMWQWEILSDRNMGLLFYINFATGFAMFAVLYYCDIYFTVVRGYGPDRAGLQLLFYTPGLGVGSYLAMFFCNRWPKQTFYPLFLGSIVEAVGIGLMAWALHGQPIGVIFGMMAVTGAGTGMRFMPGNLHGVGFFPGNIAAVISLTAVSLPFGGSLGLTIMSTVFNNVAGESKDILPILRAQNAPPEVLAPYVDMAKMGIVWAFVAITPFMLVCVLAAASLGNVYITDRRDDDFSRKNVVEGPHLIHLLRKRRGPPPLDSERDSEVTHGVVLKSGNDVVATKAQG